MYIYCHQKKTKTTQSLNFVTHPSVKAITRSATEDKTSQRLGRGDDQIRPRARTAYMVAWFPQTRMKNASVCRVVMANFRRKCPKASTPLQKASSETPMKMPAMVSVPMRQLFGNKEGRTLSVVIVFSALEVCSPNPPPSPAGDESVLRR